MRCCDNDTELLRISCSRNRPAIRNPLIFLRKMATYSCWGSFQGQAVSCKEACRDGLTLEALVSLYTIIQFSIDTKNFLRYNG